MWKATFLLFDSFFNFKLPRQIYLDMEQNNVPPGAHADLLPLLPTRTGKRLRDLFRLDSDAGLVAMQ
eukprot:scaffold208910_cov19-Tisochrysis_lutea.AAC.1